MPFRRTALALAIVSLTLPAGATAKKPASPDSSGGGSTPTTRALSDKYGSGQDDFTPKPYDRYYGIDRRVQPAPDPRSGVLTSSLAGTTSPQDFRNPDGADAARAGDIVKAMEHYQRSRPTTVSVVSPDAADAARAGEIAKAMEHYQRSQPAPAAVRPTGGSQPAASDDDTPAWPDIAVTGVILLAAAGGVAGVRMRSRRRVAA